MALPLARTRDEALLYLDLHPCGKCGSTDIAWESALVPADGGLGRSYFGTCEGCSMEREYRFRVPEKPIPPVPGSPVVFGGPEPSQLLDAGEWMWVADLVAGDVPEEPAEAARALAIATAAFDEILKFVPAGAGEVPVSAFWSKRGRRVRAEEPGRFDRERLMIVRDTYRDLAGAGRQSR
jgi:hypothetical protein